MNDKKEKREPFSTTLPTKFITILRKHALIEKRISMSEMLEIYQEAYLEREKEAKRLKKEQEQKAKQN